MSKGIDRGRIEMLALFIMLIMGTILHGSSVARIYLPAFRYIGALLTGVMR